MLRKCAGLFLARDNALDFGNTVFVRNRQLSRGIIASKRPKFSCLARFPDKVLASRRFRQLHLDPEKHLFR